ncbi:hypothetical protein POL68_25680 [Stigmatella sp. ncwal1]|uniref:Uncharacterized protein n=1 Tax=Stigmatella ashevillensis TaxID=2995309 RepID=A0ABT5DDX5_9BACT|nr:hypothetical protein [Stigmatella ashevillena]MDC0711885.1 hypothetical protein [Stigmatella ashevillena]
MNDFTSRECIRIAHTYFPIGFPVETDDSSQSIHPYQRTPEYQRWTEAWDKALAWKKWDALLEELQGAFPRHKAGDVTQPRVASCLRCCVYFEEPLPEGGRFLTRVAAAVSVLMPVYLVYATTQTLWDRRRATLPQLFFEPRSEVRQQFATLAGLLEGGLGYKPFPLQLAEVALPEIRVPYLHRASPTLLTALLSDHLENLP